MKVVTGENQYYTHYKCVVRSDVLDQLLWAWANLNLGPIHICDIKRLSNDHKKKKNNIFLSSIYLSFKNLLLAKILIWAIRFCEWIEQVKNTSTAQQ